MSIDDAINAFKRIIKNSIGIEIESASTQAPPVPPHAPTELPPSQVSELPSNSSSDSLVATPEPTKPSNEVASPTPAEISLDEPLTIPESNELAHQEIASSSTETPITVSSRDSSASSTIDIQQAPHEQKTVPQISIQTEELEVIMDLIHNLEHEFKALRENLIERIEKIERRLNELEEKIKTGQVIVKKSAPPASGSELVPSEPIEHSFQTSDIDLLLHEAQEVLHSNEISLVRLIRLEAVEWQLLKIARKTGAQGKISRQLLRDLRLEINRLRKHLLS